MTDHARLRRMCAAQTDIPSDEVVALLGEFELLAEDHDDLSRTLAYRENQLIAANAAVRGYRERAERAEAQNRAAWAVARDMVSDCEDGHADPMEVRPYAQDILRALGAEGASHARPVAACEAGSPGTALGDTPEAARPAESIVTTAHYGEAGA